MIATLRREMILNEGVERQCIELGQCNIQEDLFGMSAIAPSSIHEGRLADSTSSCFFCIEFYDLDRVSLCFLSL